MQRRASGKGRGDRVRVAVLMGGPSSEHEVSMQGGGNVVAALPPRVFEVRPVVISKDGRWRMPPRGWVLPSAEAGGRPTATDAADPESAQRLPAKAAFDPRKNDGWREYEGPWEGLVALRAWGVDVAVPILHGRFGEDGTLQACLAAADIPFVGSDAAGSALAFDKVRAKQLFRACGIDTPDFEVLCDDELRRGRRARIDSWIERHGLPIVLKNPRGGSTLEVRIAADAGEALSALEELARDGRRIMFEEHVAGRELTVGVIEDRDPESSVAREAQAVALKVHAELGLRGLSRTDLILTEDGRLRVLEVNTLPGMTERGLVPLAAACHGLAFPALVEGLVRTARLPSE